MIDQNQTKKRDIAEAAFTLIALVFLTVAILAGLFDKFLEVGEYNCETGDYNTIPITLTYIGLFAFLPVAVYFIVILSCLNIFKKESNPRYLKITNSVMFFLMFIYFILFLIMVPMIEYDREGYLLYSLDSYGIGFGTFFILFGVIIFIMGIVDAVVASKYPSEKAIKKKKEKEAKRAIPKKAKISEDEAINALIKLKKMLDAGIITEEDYEMKKKKYIDVL